MRLRSGAAATALLLAALTGCTGEIPLSDAPEDLGADPLARPRHSGELSVRLCPGAGGEFTLHHEIRVVHAAILTGVEPFGDGFAAVDAWIAPVPSGRPPEQGIAEGRRLRRTPGWDQRVALEGAAIDADRRYRVFYRADVAPGDRLEALVYHYVRDGVGGSIDLPLRVESSRRCTR